MSAPHVWTTDHEALERALHLVAVVMRPERVLIAANCGLDGNTLRAARRLMLEARWTSPAADLQRLAIDRVDAAEAEARQVERAIAEDRAVSLLEMDALHVAGVRNLACRLSRSALRRDQYGNHCPVLWWEREEPSPWRTVGLPAYCELVRLLRGESEVLHRERFRFLATAVWARLTDHERVATFEQANA